VTTLTGRSPGSVVSPRIHKRFIWTPTNLILNHRPRTEPALYAGIARLCEIAKGPIEVSRADLAHWCGADREDATGVAIEHAIRALRAGGWLIQSEGEGRKRRLLVAWGFGQDRRPRPWRFDRPDRGRPESVEVVAIPLALFDLYVGRLRLDPLALAEIDRYFARPLLAFDDIGVYAARKLGNVPATPRLAQLGLIDDQGCVDPPALDELREQAAAGTLTTCAGDGTIIAVALAERPRRRSTLAPRSSFDAQDGSATDPAPMFDGSTDGSTDSNRHLAPEGEESPLIHNVSATWDSDGKNKLIKRKNPPPTESSRARADLGAGDLSIPRTDGRTSTNQPTDSEAPPATEKRGGGSEVNHKVAQLDPVIASLHQSLNADRDISPAEWQGLLALQGQYGRDALLGWQLRAASAERCEIRLGYYLACVAGEAFATAGGHSRRSAPALDEMPDAQPPAEAAPRRSVRSTPAVPAPAPQLDRNRALLLKGIEQQLGRTARHPERLAGVPLARLVRWREIAGHPGLGKWADPMAYIIHEIAAGNDPPPLDELHAWAQQAGMSWYDPRLAAWRDSAEEWEEGAGDDDLAVPDACTMACNDSANELRSSDLDNLALLWEDMLRSLEGQTEPACRTWLRGTRLLALMDDQAIVSVPFPVTDDAAGYYTEAIRVLLRARLAREVVVRIEVAAVSPELPPPEFPPPDWIDRVTWARLDAELRIALAGSELTPDGGLNVRAEVYGLLTSRFAEPLRELLVAAYAGSAPASAWARAAP
jgi:hypothetical protein